MKEQPEINYIPTSKALDWFDEHMIQTMAMVAKGVQEAGKENKQNVEEK